MGELSDLAQNTGRLANLLSTAATARTATADGSGTGTIASGTTRVKVTASNANHIIVLPVPTGNDVIVIDVGATGFELRTNSPTTVSLNNVTGADKELAVAADTTILAISLSTTAWIAMKLDNVGAPAGGGTPD